ncbi:DUF6444 domain-containing protein [Thiothrix fructosivorans]|uniref:DUF6444 domain-containing protein n=1 Tax=Thiothrix fructosivorans TaxID=111770 RepID=UPI001F5E708C|nr:DUF6444 domain-containing protein [Thiothrix fructosivorans]
MTQQLKDHSLKQLNSQYLAKLTPEELLHLSTKLLHDLKEAREQINQNSNNSSKPPAAVSRGKRHPKRWLCPKQKGWVQPEESQPRNQKLWRAQSQPNQPNAKRVNNPAHRVMVGYGIRPSMQTNTITQPM